MYTYVRLPPIDLNPNLCPPLPPTSQELCTYGMTITPRVHNDLMPSSLLLEDVKTCSQFFVQLHYSHTRRESNKIAHNLARNAINVPDYTG